MRPLATATASGDIASPRRGGRPLSTRVHRAILDATVELFSELGFEAMSVERVAARAGVGKAAIYRRWPSKEKLVIEAVGSLVADVQVPDTGDVREDLVAGIRALVDFMTSDKAGGIIPRMAAEVAGGTPLGRRYVASVIEPRRELVRAAIERGIGRGELPADLDVRIVTDSLVGPVLLRRLLGELSELPKEFPERLVDTILQRSRKT